MTHDASTARHPIRVVSLRTGLTPATIRAWERRYEAVEPARSEGGQRLYSDHDIARLTTLRALTSRGRSISSVATLPPEAAEALLSEDLEATPSGTTQDLDAWVDDAFQHVSELDAEGLERTLWRAFLTLGAQPFLDGVAAPLLRKVGSAWAAGRITPAEEHMGSGVLERVLAWMSDPAMSVQDGPPVVVTTLPGERHGLGARLAAAAAAVEGWRTTYLGADLPVADIAAATKEVGAKLLAISIVRTDRAAETIAALTELRGALGAEVTVMVGGAGAEALHRNRLPQGVMVVAGLEAFARPHSDGTAPSAH